MVVLCTNSSFGTCVPGRYIAVGLSSGVAVKRGSTVYIHYAVYNIYIVYTRMIMTIILY